MIKSLVASLSLIFLISCGESSGGKGDNNQRIIQSGEAEEILKQNGKTKLEVMLVLYRDFSPKMRATLDQNYSINCTEKCEIRKVK